MASFLLDDGVGTEIATLLRGHGHIVITTAEVKKAFASNQDPAINSPLAFLLKEIISARLILVTPDRRLAERLRDTYPNHPGIVFCPKVAAMDAMAREELTLAIESVVSARFGFDGHADGLFYKPFIGNWGNKSLRHARPKHYPGKKAGRRPR
jgi:hypothetical protein